MSEIIRVLHVFGTLNRGGAESMIMNYYRNIDRTKIQFDFVVHRDSPGAFETEITEMGGLIYRAPQYKGINHFAYLAWWKRFFIDHPEYQIIHCHVDSTAAIILREAKKRRLTTISHSHSTSSGSGISAYIKEINHKRIACHADYCFACSQQAGRWLFKNHTFSIVHNAINPRDFAYSSKTRDDVRAELGIQPDVFTVGHVGRFDLAKNQLYLVDVFASIHKQNPNSCLLLVGDGINRKLVEKKVQELDLLEFVIFAGVRDNVNRLLQAVDAFVFPSLFEGLPVTVIEAQASGLPCVISDSITDEVAITNLVSFLSITETPEEWAKRVVQSNKCNNRRDTSSEIASAGYDIHGAAKRLFDFYIAAAPIE